MSKTKSKNDQSPNEDEPEEYTVEKIIDSRINAHGVKEYFLKWIGYDDKDNTWEPEDNLDCPGLIRAFEAERTKEKERKKRKAAGTPTDEMKGAKRKNDEKKVHGFDRGLQPEKIIGATDSSGILIYDFL